MIGDRIWELLLRATANGPRPPDRGSFTSHADLPPSSRFGQMPRVAGLYPPDRSIGPPSFQS